MNPHVTSSHSLSISQAVDYLRKPKSVLCLQLDAHFYLAANAYDEEGIQEINRLKNRREGRPLVLAFADLKSARTAQLNSPLLSLLPKFKGNLTVSVPSPPDLPTPAHRGTGMIGVRLLAQTFINQLLEQLQAPLVLSSANPVGQTTAKNLVQLSTYQLDHLPLLLDPMQDIEESVEVKATVITWVHSDLKLLAEGDVSLAEVQTEWDALRQ